MGEVLDERAGRDAPPTSRVRDLLQTILKVAETYAPPETEAEPESETMGDSGASAAETASSGTATAHAARPVTRDDMLRELGRIAEFFRRTEPHSPLAYTLEEAVRRGRLSWPELLAEVVPDSAARGAMLTMLGIRPITPDAKE